MISSMTIGKKKTILHDGRQLKCISRYSCYHFQLSTVIWCWSSYLFSSYGWSLWRPFHWHVRTHCSKVTEVRLWQWPRPRAPVSTDSRSPLLADSGGLLADSGDLLADSGGLLADSGGLQADSGALLAGYPPLFRLPSSLPALYWSVQASPSHCPPPLVLHQLHRPPVVRTQFSWRPTLINLQHNCHEGLRRSYTKLSTT